MIICRFTMMAMLGVVAVLTAGPVRSEPARVVSTSTSANLAKVITASYIHLTYVYHAIDAYLEHLSQYEQWMAVEHLYLNLAYRHIEDLVDPSSGLPRMAK